MAEIERKLNIVEKANKVITFRKYIREECRKKGMEYPSDDKIAEYITSGYGMDVDDFMKDYIEKEGIFREPIVDFIKEINEIQWGEDKPTEDEIKDFVAKYGYDLNKFITEHVITSYEPLVRSTLIATLNLSDAKLVKLWNEFIEESSLYGEDSHIYDITDHKDLSFLRTHMKPADFYKIQQIAAKNEAKYVQWFYLNDGDMHAKTDIKGVIVAYWGEIFERIMLYPIAYSFNVEKYAEGDGSTYFDDVFFPIIAEKVGYKIDGDKGIITKIEK